MRFGVLGTLAVWTEDGRLVPVPEAKVRALLADLLLHLGRPVSADRLIEDLWGDDLPVHPANALQSKVSRLRQALENAEPAGGELVVSRSPGYLLQLDGGAVDEGRFAALIERAGATQDPRDRAALLADALALWRGPPLAEFADAMFAQAAIARLEEQRLAALEEQAEARLALGEHSLLAGEIGELVARHPLRERLRAAHMLALYRAGRQAEAVNSYLELRSRLAGDLGLDAGPGLAALYQAILEHAPGLRGVPAPPTLAARRRSNLPAMLTDMVGRAAAVAELRALLNERRLVTLTGPGGVGKTRLALETATQSAGAFPDGVWLVELAGPSLAGVGTPADAVMAVLGIGDNNARDPADVLADVLRASRMLLILDNCEHLVDQAAQLTTRLLQAAPGLHVLATSREPLMLTGEIVWAVPPLELPEPAADPEPAALAQFSAPSSCSSRAPVRPRRAFASMRETPGRSRRSAGGSTGFRWRWSWRRPGSGAWASTSSSPGSTTGSGCWSPGTATPRHDSRPSGPSSTGAGGCSPSPNASCCVGWPCPRTAARWMPQRRSAPKMAWMCQVWWPGWWIAPSSLSRTRRTVPGTGCWTASPHTACSASARRERPPRRGSGTGVTIPTLPNAPQRTFAATTSAPGSCGWTPRQPTCAARWTPPERTTTRPPFGWSTPWPGTGSCAAG